MVREKDLHTSPTRNSNIELLRIISMLMIVAYHYSLNGFYAEDIMYTSNKYFVDVFGMGGKLGTNLFVLISGYYLVNSRFTVKKILELMGQIWFYTLTALLIFALIPGLVQIGLHHIKISLLPLFTSHYWFASYYVILLVLSPFLNTLIHSLNKLQHGMLCLAGFALCTFIPEFLHISFASGYLPLFISLYFCAAYCRLHIGNTNKIARRSMLFALLFGLLCIARILITDFLWQRSGNSTKLANSVNFMGAYSPFAFVIGVLLLLAFSCARPRSNRFIMWLGGTSFGVYLFHDNYFIREFLWQRLFHTSDFASSPLLFIHAFSVLIAIYTAGSIVELGRKTFFAPVWNKLVARISPSIQKILERLFASVLDLLHCLIGDN